MDDVKTIEVRYISFPDIEDGILGFYRDLADHDCTPPRYFYKHSEKSSSFCHIRTPEEMDGLSRQADAMTREEFQKYRTDAGFKTWINAYGVYLSEELGKRLQDGGILLKINGSDIGFICPQGKFVQWKGKAGS